jgi:hypothetical protein
MLTQKLGVGFLVTSPLLVAIHTIKQIMDMITLHPSIRTTRVRIYSTRRYEIVGSRTIKIRVKTKNLWIKQYFRRNKSNRCDLTDITFKLSRY